VKKALLTLAIALLSLFGHAQIGAGVNFGVMRYSPGVTFKFPEETNMILMYGAHGTFNELSERIRIRGTFSTGAIQDVFMVSDGNESASGDYRFRFTTISCEILRAMGDLDMELGGFYSGVGLGLGFARAIVETTGPLASEVNRNDGAMQYYLRGFVGFNLAFYSGMDFFVEANVNVPFFSRLAYGTDELPMTGSLALNAGLRKNF
jgi:hypothetical protein